MHSSVIFPIRLLFIFAVLLILAQGCRNLRRQKIVPLPVEVAQRPEAPDEHIMPRDSMDAIYTGLKPELADFYALRDRRPVWFSRDRLSPAGDSLLRFIAGIRYYGLLPSNYHVDEIAQHLRNGLDNTARVDALMTDAFLSVTKDLMFGRLTPENDASDSIALHLLDVVAKRGGVWPGFQSVEPQLEGYQRLKDALKIMLDSLSLSDRLAVLQDSGDVSDALNATIQGIEVNLERWRWEIGLRERRYIFVNIPAFMLYVISDGAVVMESRVIVGKPETQTPELTSVVDCFVTYPYWHVPRKIAVEEYLPIIQRDTSFLSRNNFDVLDRRGLVVDADSIPWRTFSKNYFPVSLRQRDGKENSLGILKFVFDNPYAVFLHDTNAKRLFYSDVRAFSHGCIRMEKAVALSHYLLTGDVGKQSPVIERYLKEEVRHTINLPASAPIYIRYFTVSAMGDSVVFHKDIYHKDEAIIKRLYGERGPDL